MSAINQVTISGNLCATPELKATRTGTPVVDLRIAVNEPVRDEKGAWTTRPNFFSVVVYGKRAEGLQKHLTKGQKLAVSGRLSWRSWQKDDEKRERVYIVAKDIEFLSPSNNEDDPQGLGVPEGAVQTRMSEGLYDEDVSF